MIKFSIKLIFAFVITTFLMVSIPLFQLIKSGRFKDKKELRIVKVVSAKSVNKKKKKIVKKIKKIKVQKSRNMQRNSRSMGRFALDLTASSADGNAISLANTKSDGYKTWEVDVKAREKRVVVPIFPKEAEEKEIEGRVILEIIVNEQGRVANITIIEENPEGLEFGRAASEAARQWEFEPASIEGVPVKYTFRRPIDFKLE